MALAPEFTERHERVNHIVGEYVRGDVTTNSIESAFSLLKRGAEADVFIETVKRLRGFKPLRFAELTSEKP